MTLSTLTRFSRSFTARMVLGTALILLFSTLGVNYASYRSASLALQHRELDHGRSLTRILADNARLGMFTNDPARLTAAAALLADSDPDIDRILFFDETNHLVATYGTAPQGQDTLASAVATRLEGPSPITPFTFRHNDSLVVVETVRAEPHQQSPDSQEVEDLPYGLQRLGEERRIGYVALTLDSAIKRQRERAALTRNATVTLIIVLISITMICVVILRLTRPLRALVQEIRHDLPQDPGSLGIPTDFSELIATIRQSHRTMQDFAYALEEQVDIRTRQLTESNHELRLQKDALAQSNKQLAQILEELRVTQTNLVQSEKMAALGMTIAGLSHEIKNSINFITGSLPLLKRLLQPLLEEGSPPPTMDQSDKVSKLLSYIETGVERTVRVVNDLNFFSHAGSQTPTPTDILPVLANSVAIIRHEHSRRLTVTEEHAEPSLMVQGIAGQLNQVFLNILLNATQAIDGPGAITIRSWQDEGSAHISITDTGPGIDRQHLNRIFDPFFTTKEVGQGTGLGLSVSYSIIQKHGGTITVSSHPGQGTCFEIILPLLAGAEG